MIFDDRPPIADLMIPLIHIRKVVANPNAQMCHDRISLQLGIVHAARTTWILETRDRKRITASRMSFRLEGYFRLTCPDLWTTDSQCVNTEQRLRCMMPGKVWCEPLIHYWILLGLHVDFSLGRPIAIPY